MLLFIVLPIYLAACYYNATVSYNVGQPIDFVDREAVLIGLFSIVVFALGCGFGSYVGFASGRSGPLVDGFTDTLSVRYFRMLRVCGYLSILAYALFLGSLLTRMDLIAAMLAGTRGASAQLHEALGRIPGITSFIQIGYVFFALLAGRSFFTRKPIPFDILVFALAIFLLTLARSIFASERLALLEVLAAIAVLPLSFYWRPSLLRLLIPFIGVVFVFVFFSIAEYFRSWQYYQNFYNSFYDFMIERFIGYFSTSVNNGAGVHALNIELTWSQAFAWLYKFPIIGNKIFGDVADNWGLYLTLYGTLEFNNPGGMFVAVNEFGFFFGTLLNFAFGMFVGGAYASFAKRNPYGVVLYPCLLLGVSDFVRIFYFGGARLFPIFMFAVLIAYYLNRPGRPAIHASPQRFGGGLAVQRDA